MWRISSFKFLTLRKIEISDRCMFKTVGSQVLSIAHFGAEIVSWLALCVFVEIKKQLYLENDKAYIAWLVGGRFLCTITPCKLNMTSSGSESALEDTIFQLFNVFIATTCTSSSCILMVILFNIYIK